MNPQNLPNAPQDSSKYTGNEITIGNAVTSSEADWVCTGCGTRLDAAVARMCPDCGHTVFDYQPVENE